MTHIKITASTTVHRYSVRCKDARFLTYAIYDNESEKWVKDSEDTDLVKVNLQASSMNMPRFKVYKVGRKSGRRSIIRKNLTENEARQLVKSFPNSNRSMVCYTRQ